MHTENENILVVYTNLIYETIAGKNAKYFAFARSSRTEVFCKKGGL